MPNESALPAIDSLLILECHFGTLIGLPDCSGSKSHKFDSRIFPYRMKINLNNLFCVRQRDGTADYITSYRSSSHDLLSP